MNRLLVAAVLLHSALAAAAQQKLIALTFDDGPRPYVLYGEGPAQAAGGLLSVLEHNHAPATFFYMGWRLVPKQYGDRREFRTRMTTLEAARDVARRGYEIEDHSYSHVQFRLFEKEHGEQGVLADVDRASALIQQITGHRATFVRPPDWVLTRDISQKLTARGYRVMTISPALPPALRDVNSADYLCAGEHPAKCPRPSLERFVLDEIARRERHGVYTHILAFHELSTTTAMLKSLLPDLQARGYRFVTLRQYMHDVGEPRQAALAPAALKSH
jgi:peptidoglycan/xylan/chitin deacetylase (PgdA/CDA1 family)